MHEEVPSPAELLDQWRDATRAAELADRLALLAAENVERADKGAVAAEEIARMAERAARAAERAAMSARKAATRAAAFAQEARAGRLADADKTVAQTRIEEAAARDRYHQAERAARERHGS
jgi:hypothetical protein